MQQILGVRVALYSPQHNEVYEISAFYAEMFIFYFLWSVNSCPIKALTVASGNTFSNHWAFTVTETEALKYHF